MSAVPKRFLPAGVGNFSSQASNGYHEVLITFSSGNVKVCMSIRLPLIGCSYGYHACITAKSDHGRGDLDNVSGVLSRGAIR